MPKKTVTPASERYKNDIAYASLTPTQKCVVLQRRLEDLEEVRREELLYFVQRLAFYRSAEKNSKTAKSIHTWLMLAASILGVLTIAISSMPETLKLVIRVVVILVSAFALAALYFEKQQWPEERSSPQTVDVHD